MEKTTKTTWHFTPDEVFEAVKYWMWNKQGGGTAFDESRGKLSYAFPNDMDTDDDDILFSIILTEGE